MLSYVHGTSTAPLLGETIGACFDRAAGRWPDIEAVVVPHQGIRWTYRQLKQEVDAVAAGFLALGLQPGERVGIWAPNTWEWVVTQFATAKAGLILVNVNPAYRLAELDCSSGYLPLTWSAAWYVSRAGCGSSRRLRRDVSSRKSCVI